MARITCETSLTLKESIMCLKPNSYKSLSDHFATFFKLQGLMASIFCVLDQ